MMMMMANYLLIATVAAMRGGAEMHGLIQAPLSGMARVVHEDVVRAVGTQGAAAACGARLDELRRLVDAGELKQMIDLSTALGEADRAALPAECSTDKPHAGYADIAVWASRPWHVGDPVEEGVFIKMECSDKFVALVESGARRFYVSKTAVPVTGVEIDETFVLAEAPLRCDEQNDGVLCRGAGMRDGRRFKSVADALTSIDNKTVETRLEPALNESTSRRLRGGPTPLGTVTRAFENDIETSYFVGSKSILFIPVCSNDYAPSCSGRLDYNEINGDLDGYLSTVVSEANTFFDENSYGAFDLTATITTERFPLAYSQSACGDVFLSMWTTQNATSIDVMAAAAAEAAGYVLADYDFYAVVMDYCGDLSWAGRAWVGRSWMALNLAAYDYDPGFVHELGHNGGARHAGIMTGGAHGAVAYMDAPNSYVEYGSPHSTMGGGDFLDGPGYAHFYGGVQKLFDWIPDNKVKSLQPWDFETGAINCNPCRTKLARIDDGFLSNNVWRFELAEVECEATQTAFYFEYRTQSITPSVLAYWGTIDSTGGETGIAGPTILVDATPETDSVLDAGITVGSSVTLDLAASNATSFPITVSVSEGDTNGKFVWLEIDVATRAPTVSVAPMPAPTSAPTPAPIATSQCGGNACGCTSFTLSDSDAITSGLPFTDLTFTNIACCDGECAFETYSSLVGSLYLEKLTGSFGSYYFLMLDPPCIPFGSFTYYAVFDVATIENAC